MRLPGKGNLLKTRGARPVHQIVSTIKWIRTRKLSIKNFSLECVRHKKSVGTRRAAQDVKTGVLVCLCACVRGRKREREIERESKRERERERERER